MMAQLVVRKAGPSVTLQDQGRAGYLAKGLSIGGAMDRLALMEGACLLQQSPQLPVLEMAGAGGEFEVTEPVVVALTGAPMAARLDDAVLPWNMAHEIAPGQVLRIGGLQSGSYGYLHVAGGFEAKRNLGSVSVDFSAGIGRAVRPGDRLQISGKGAAAGLVLDVEDRFHGGVIRVLPSLQTELFHGDLDRFERTLFKRDPRANRMGVRLVSDDAPFRAVDGRTILSEVVVPGDIQMTGEGDPFVLLYECQTTGGYPRIATVIPADMPRLVQAPSGSEISFRFIDIEQAVAVQSAYRAQLKALPGLVRQSVRRVEDVRELLSYQLVGGVVSATDPQEG